MPTLILIRHGQSQWNLENRFTGWTDVPLTAQGAKEAALCAEVLREFRLDRGFASRLQRSQKTLSTVLGVLGRTDLPVEYDSALNERHYGDLQGLDKAETAQKYGKEQVQLWRRSFATRPPGGESMEDCERRTMPFYLQYVHPHVLNGETVIVSAHGNSLRPILKHFDKLTPDEAATLELGFCTPIIYAFAPDGSVLSKEIREVPGITSKGTASIDGK